MALKTRIDLAPLHGAQKRLTVKEHIDLPPFNGVSFPQGADVELDIDRNGSSVSVAGTVRGVVTADCDRCLETFTKPLEIAIEEHFMLGAMGDPYGESNVVEDDQLDLADLVRQTVDAALPLSMICREDCVGLCPGCGRDLNEGTCDCEPLLKGDHGQPEMEDPPLQDP